MTQLHCPRCSQVLGRQGDQIHCDGCTAFWPIQRGVPRFFPRAPYWGEVSQENMGCVLTDVESAGWRAALQRNLSPEEWARIGYLLDSESRPWESLVSLPDRPRVLDVGCGLGAISEGFARRGAELVCADAVPERAAFTAARCRQEGAADVTPIQCDAGALPVADGEFDVIVLNHVLEWVGCSSSEPDPRASQRRILSHIYRKLRPGGSLCVAIENRFTPVTRFRDPHAGMRFTTWMPQGLANRWSLWRRGTPYRTPLYSYGALGRLLRKTGFESTHFYAPLPSSRNMRYLAALDDKRFTRHALGQMFDIKHPTLSLAVRSVNTKLPLHWLLARCAPEFMVVAQRELDAR